MANTWEWYDAPNSFGADMLDRKMPRDGGENTGYFTWWQNYHKYIKGDDGALDTMLTAVTPTVPPDGRDVQQYGYNLPQPEPKAPPKTSIAKSKTVRVAVGASIVLIPLLGIPALLWLKVGLGAAVMAFVILAFIEFVAVAFEQTERYIK